MHPWVGLSDHVRLGAVARWVTPELAAGALDDCGVRDKKPGALPAGFMVYFTLALALFQQDSCDDVAEHMVGGVPELGGPRSTPSSASWAPWSGPDACPARRPRLRCARCRRDRRRDRRAPAGSGPGLPPPGSPAPRRSRSGRCHGGKVRLSRGGNRRMNCAAHDRRDPGPRPRPRARTWRDARGARGFPEYGLLRPGTPAPRGRARGPA
jgi:hypothetical protein